MPDNSTPKHHHNKMGTEPIGKLLLSMSLPAMFSMLIQALYNIVDSIYVAQIGEHALTAVSLAFPVQNLMIAVSVGTGVGLNSLIARRLGERREQEASAAATHGVLISLAESLLFLLFGLFFCRMFFSAFTSDSTVIQMGVDYTSIVTIFSFGSFIQINLEKTLQATGNMFYPMVFQLIGAITNIILDLVLIAGLKMGVAGAAIATDISQLVSCVLSLRFLMKVDADYKVELSAIRPDQRMTSRIIRIGLPTGIQNMVISFSNVLVQSSVNSYGAAAMAGFAAYMKIDGFNILPVTSFSMAATTFVGQNYGAGNLKRVKNGMWVTLGMGVLYTLCTGALLLAFQNPIMHLFTSDETVVAFGCSAMHYFCPFYFLLAILHGMAGAVRGTGRSVPPMVVLLISLCLFRVVWIQFVLPFFAGIEGVFVLYPVSWALGAVLMALYAWKGSWMTYEHS